MFGGVYAAYGTEEPFFPSFLATRGLSVESIGTCLAVGTIVRLLVGPLLGVCADRLGIKSVLATLLCGSGAIIFLYLASFGFWPILLVILLHSVTTAPLTSFADALALRASGEERVFAYGWVRGFGSAGFVAGLLVGGALVERFGLWSIIVAAGVLFFLSAIPVPRLPGGASAEAAVARGSLVHLFSNRTFGVVLAIAMLVIGSHAMINTFSVIHWRAAGISATTVSLLWTEATASEILVFFATGPFLLDRLGPARCAALAAFAGIVRWAALAMTSQVAILAATQMLNGLTFALMHLVCMQLIAATIPERFSATAQTIYGTLCLGIASAIFTWASGLLYGSIGANAFWLMSASCAVALPMTFALPGYRRQFEDAQRL